MRHLFMMAAAIASVTGCATAGGERGGISEKAAAKLAEFERTGDIKSCVNIRSISQMTALDDRHFLVRTGANDYYLNEISGRCAGASNGFNRIQYSTSISQLCRNEIITIVENSTGFTAGSCGLSGFERLDKKPSE